MTNNELPKIRREKIPLPFGTKAVIFISHPLSTTRNKILEIKERREKKEIDSAITLLTTEINPAIREKYLLQQKISDWSIGMSTRQMNAGLSNEFGITSYYPRFIEYHEATDRQLDSIIRLDAVDVLSKYGVAVPEIIQQEYPVNELGEEPITHLIPITIGIPT